jgi:hypothetical protein
MVDIVDWVSLFSEKAERHLFGLPKRSTPLDLFGYVSGVCHGSLE